MQIRLRIWVSTLIVWFLCVVPSVCYGDVIQNDTWRTMRATQGRNFWFTYMLNAGSQVDDDQLSLRLHIATEALSATCNITVGGQTYTVIVRRDSVKTFVIPTDKRDFAYIYTEQQEALKGVHVTSTQDVSLYISNYGSSSYDASMVLPVPSLANEYLVQTYSTDRFATEFVVLATSSDTYVNIYPSDTTSRGNHLSNAYAVSLDEGEAVLIRSKSNSGDLSGSRIYATKPVAVFAGNQSAIIPNMAGLSDDHSFEQMVPLRYWGKEFAITSGVRQGQNKVRVTAAYDSTYVHLNGTQLTMLMSGQSHTISNVIGDGWLTTSKPVMCNMFFVSAMANLPNMGWGDPSMVMMVPVEQGLNSLLFAPYKVEGAHDSIMEHYVNIVTETSAVGSMRMNNQSISSQFVSMTNNSAYSYARIPLADSISYKLQNNSATFTAYVYGLGAAESYAYSAGFNNRYNDFYMLTGGGGGGSGGAGGAGGAGGSGGGSGGAGGSGGGSGGAGGSGEGGQTTRPLDRRDMIQICINEDSLEFHAVKIADGEVLGWDFGDATMIVSNDTVVKHKYQAVGTYRAAMIIRRLLPGWLNHYMVDSIFTEVNVVDTYYRNYSERMCLGDSIVFANNIIYADSLEPYVVHTFIDSSLNVAGCDSITTLNIYVGKPDTTVFDTIVWPVQLPFTDSRVQNFYQLHNMTKDSTYVVTTKCKLSPCDSTIIYNFRVHPVYNFTCADTVCQNSEFMWPDSIGPFIYSDGKRVTKIPTNKVGTFEYSANNGRDSIWELTLTVMPTYSVTEQLRVCDNDTISWENRLYVGPKCEHVIDSTLFDSVLTISVGLNYDTVRYGTMVSDCDSLHILKLNVQSTDTMVLRPYHICETETIEFFDSVYSFYPVEADTSITLLGMMTSSIGCDSIVQQTIIVHPCDTFYSIDTVFQFVPYIWTDHEDRDIYVNGYRRWEISTEYPGDYVVEDRLYSRWGCDSLFILNLFVAPVYANHTEVDICDNDTVSWQRILFVGNYFTDTIDSTLYDSIKTRPYGDYNDTIRYLTPYGSDSTFTLNLRIHNTAAVVDSDTVCNNYLYVYGDSIYDFSAWPNDTSIVIYGLFEPPWNCDSLVERHLTIHPSYIHYEDTTICSSEDLTWRGHTKVNLWPSGTYYDTVPTQWGCDSVFALRLQSLPSFLDVLRDTVCTNDTILFQNSLIYYNPDVDKSGKEHFYEQRYFRENNCDSVFRLFLTWYPSYHFYDTASICHMDTLDWRGRRLTEEGTYRDTLQTVNGCDSIYEIFVLVGSHYLFLTEDTICKSSSYTWRDSIYHFTVADTVITFYERFSTVHGMCDSIYQLNLYIAPEYSYFDTIHICDNDTLEWQNMLFVGARFLGTYDNSMYSSVVVDSIGIYDYVGSYTTMLGCDSIFHLNLKVSSTDTTILYNDWCSSEPFVFYDTIYDLSIYPADTTIVLYKTLQNEHGCDSVITQALTVRPQHFNVFADTTCMDSTVYHWPDHTGHTFWMGDSAFNSISVQEEGTYVIRDSMQSVYGCDSVWELRLLVAPVFDIIETDTVCSNSLPYSWHGKSLSEEGIYWDSLYTVLGYDSVFQMNLVVLPSPYEIVTVNLCEGDTLHLSNQDVTTEGVFRDTLVTSLGCDSVCEYHVMLHPVYSSLEREMICEGDVFWWRGYDLHTWSAGKYEISDTLHSYWGCDSVETMQIVIAPHYYHVDSAIICPGDTFFFQGSALTKAGWYSDSLISALGCDSVEVLYLSYECHSYDTICEGEIFNFNGYPLTETGVYYDSLWSRFGYDSVYVEHLTVEHPMLIHEEGLICRNEHYWFRGMDLTSPGVYRDTIRSERGCDSIYFELNLRILNEGHSIVEADYCNVGQLEFLNIRENLGIFQTDTTIRRTALTTTEYGCDSIIELVAHIHPHWSFSQVDSVLQGDTYVWEGHEGHTFTLEDGTTTSTIPTLSRGWVTIYDSLQTVYGCDSTFTLNLYVISHRVTNEVEFCEGDSLVLSNKVVYTSGIYVDSLIANQGYDSIIDYMVTVHPKYYQIEREAICEGENYTWHGRNFKWYPVGFHEVRDSLFSEHGCDSVHVLQLIISPQYHFPDTATICPGDTLEFRGQLLSKAGVYYDSLLSVFGCDSVYSMRLNYRCDMYDTICSGAPFVFQSHLLTQTGVYYENFITREGFDSLFVEHLIVNPPYFIPSYDTICNDEYLDFRGRKLNETGVYFDSLMTVEGCDSVFCLTLTVLPTSEATTYDTMCVGDTYYFNGKPLLQGGYYTDTTLNMYGCHHTDHLYLHQISPTVINVEAQEFCADDNYLNFLYTYSGLAPIEYSILFSKEAEQEGFTSFTHLPIDVENTISVPYEQHPWDKTVYPRPNRYRATVFLHNGICSDSLIMQELIFEVTYPSWIAEQHWNDVISVLNDSLNGGYTFSAYQWYYNDMVLFGENKPYLYIYPKLDMEGEYRVALTRTDDGISMKTCPIRPMLVEDFSLSANGTIVVTPTTMTVTNPECRLNSDVSGEWCIYSGTGSFWQRGQVTAGVECPLVLPPVGGYYFIVVNADNGYQKYIKVIVK